MPPIRFQPPLWFRIVYSVLVLPLGIGAVDGVLNGDASLLRRFAAFVFGLGVAWLLASLWTAGVVVRTEALEVRRLWPGRHLHPWPTVVECRHGRVLSFVVLRDGRWVVMGWIDRPGQLQLAIAASIPPR